MFSDKGASTGQVGFEMSYTIWKEDRIVHNLEDEERIMISFILA